MIGTINHTLTHMKEKVEPQNTVDAGDKTLFFQKESDRASAEKQLPEMFFHAGGAQTKLTVGEPGDQFERQAERVAEIITGTHDNITHNPGVNKLQLFKEQGLASNVKKPGIKELEEWEYTPVKDEEEGESLQWEEKEYKETEKKDIEDPEYSTVKEDTKEESLQWEEKEYKETENKDFEEPGYSSVKEDTKGESMQWEEKEYKETEKQDIEEPDYSTVKHEEENTFTEDELHLFEEEEKPLQLKSSDGERLINDSLEHQIKTAKGKGKPLHDPVQKEMSESFGYDFSHVNIHTGPESEQMSTSLGAQAFTHGKDIFFNSGKYAPNKSSGKKLLAHELTHVVQQNKSTVSPGVQGIFKRIGRGLKKAGKAISRGVKKVGRDVKKAGKRLLKGVRKITRKLGEKIKGIFHRAKRWITSLPKRLHRLVGHLWKGVKSLKPWSLDWWKSLGKADTWKSFGKWLGELAIYVVEVSGLPEIYETLADFIKFNTRPLTGAEKAMARDVFGESIDYDLVRIDEKAVLGPSWTDRPYVSFHTINSWGPMSPDTLIHELTHVWQYEKMGAMYMPRALHGNNKPGFYDYGGLDALEENKEKGMDAFNVEEQGEIIADYYRIKNDMAPVYSTGTKENIGIYQIYVNEVKAK